MELGALHDRDEQINDPSAVIGVLSGLMPNVKYRIHVFARTKEGRGESTFIEARTTEHLGMLIFSRPIGPFIHIERIVPDPAVSSLRPSPILSWRLIMK